MLLIVSPPSSVPSTLMPLPSRSTSAGLPVVLDTALLPCSPLPPAPKETESDCLCPDGCAPRGNVTVQVLETSCARKLRNRKPSLFNAFEIFDHTGSGTLADYSNPSPWPFRSIALVPGESSC